MKQFSPQKAQSDKIEILLPKWHEFATRAKIVENEEDCPNISAVGYSGQKGLVEIVEMY